MWKEILLVGLGGGAGSILRYLTSLVFKKISTSDFPWATLIVNITGCLLIGILIGFFGKHLLNPNLKLLFVTGFCGGYTTFSAFALENLNLWQTNQHYILAAYILASIVGGLAAVWLGFSISK